MHDHIIAITEGGRRLAEAIAAGLPTGLIDRQPEKIATKIARLWPHSHGLICIMASGIVVRAIAPLLGDKTCDPAVVVVDEQGRHAISLLSGHLGGGNDLARRIAAICGGTAVITTASDVLGHTALDLWAKRNHVWIGDRQQLTAVSARLVNRGRIFVAADIELGHLPDDFSQIADPAAADLLLSCKQGMTFPGLRGIPQILYLGIGCNRGTSCAAIEQAFRELCADADLHPQAFAGCASIDVKNDEEGLLQFAEKFKRDLCFFTREQLNAVTGVSYSPAVMAAVGAQGVAEPAALLAAGADGSSCRLLIEKRKWRDVTLAVALKEKKEWR